MFQMQKFTTKPYQAPGTAPLPKTRTEGTTPYKVIGVDFAGPLRYRVKKNQEGKAYLVLFSCSLTRGVYLEVEKCLETATFLRRRGRPSLIYSDNFSLGIFSSPISSTSRITLPSSTSNSPGTLYIYLLINSPR